MLNRPVMNDDLVHRLLFAETGFLDALQNGSQMLASYRDSFSDLPSALFTASKMGDSQCIETLSLAHSVASRILNIANCYLHVKHEEEDFSAKMRTDCDVMLHQMAALDLNADLQTGKRGDERCSHSNSSTPFSSARSSTPFLASAHQWLVDNLHNPYPTAEVKTQIAAASSCEVSSVNSWFINARRRIGWTTLCRERFSNCRADMIDAAYRALVDEDPRPALSPGLAHTFVVMKAAAEGLYASTFTRSVLAGDLVKDTDKDGESTGHGEYHQVEKASLLKAVQDSYPSPDRSRTTSPINAIGDLSTGESEVEEDVTPPIIAGLKRRRSSIVDEPSSTACRPIKRLRASMTSRACLPSPSSSTDGIDESSDHCLPGLSTTHSTLSETNAVLAIHKRRLSDTDATRIPPRVSAPPPRSNTENEHSIDDWFNTNFDALFTIPPPVDVIQPDFSAGWEVELFKDYSLPGNAPTCLPALTDTNIPTPSDLSELDNLFRSIGDDIFVTPPHDSPPSNISEALYTTSANPSIPDISISQTGIDWIPLLNDPGTCQPAIYSAFPQYPIDSQPLPEIDLSMIQLPHLMPAVSSQGDVASKQAKLDQLHAMQEVVRRMERELESEGVLI